MVEIGEIQAKSHCPERPVINTNILNRFKSAVVPVRVSRAAVSQSICSLPSLRGIASANCGPAGPEMQRILGNGSKAVSIHASGLVKLLFPGRNSLNS
jgi:hypothetical protein